MLKSFKGKLIVDFRQKNANVQVRDKTLRQFAKDKFMCMGLLNGGKNFKSKASPNVDLDHQCCFEQRGLEAKERLF